MEVKGVSVWVFFFVVRWRVAPIAERCTCQALSALADLGLITKKDVLSGFKDQHHGVRRNALRVSSQSLSQDPQLVNGMIRLLEDKDSQVRREAAYALGNYRSKEVARALGKFIAEHPKDPYLRTAALTAASNFPEEVLLTVLDLQESPEKSVIINELIINELSGVLMQKRYSPETNLPEVAAISIFSRKYCMLAAPCSKPLSSSTYLCRPCISETTSHKPSCSTCCNDGSPDL